MTDHTNNTNSARRSFLLKAASVAVGSAAASVAGSYALAYQGAPDPILAAIESHRAATAAVHSAIDVQTVLERELPRDKRKSSVNSWEEKIVATDDPRWIECERAIIRSFGAETDAACALVNVPPATLAGVLALLQYANTADKDGEMWHHELQSDDGTKTKTRSWHYFLIETLAEALPGLIEGRAQ
jgi:hypothetical protein